MQHPAKVHNRKVELVRLQHTPFPLIKKVMLLDELVKVLSCIFAATQVRILQSIYKDNFIGVYYVEEIRETV